MEIEQKERERIEADVDAYIKKLWHDVNSPNTKSPKIVEAIAHFRAGKQSEHLYLQKEVIQPKDKRISELEAELKEVTKRKEDLNGALRFAFDEQEKLEAENKALREAAINIMTATRNTEQKAYEAMHKLLTKNEG
jgi:predicted  nucleic acid-binding Zn-ribbon protein